MNSFILDLNGILFAVQLIVLLMIGYAPIRHFSRRSLLTDIALVPLPTMERFAHGVCLALTQRLFSCDS